MRRSMHGLVVLAALGFAACDSIDVVYTHEAGEITGGAQWLKGTHVVNGNLTITNGVLDVAPCSTIEMAAGAGIDVENGGAIRLVGTADCPITITSANAMPTPGDWDNIDLYATGDNANNVFDYVTIEYGGDDYYGVLWAESGASFSMTNSTVWHNTSRGVELQDGVTLPHFSNNTLTNNGTVGIALYANDVGQLGEGVYTPNGVEGVEVLGGTVDHDQTWLELGTRYLVRGDVDIEGAGSAILTLSPGVTLAMDANRGIDVRANGSIEALGTDTAPVTFTSAKSTPSAGDWDEVDLYWDSMPSQFDNTVFEYGGSGDDWGMLWVDDGADASVTNSTFQDGAAYGVDLYETGHLTAFSNNTLVNNAFGPVRVYPDGIGMLDAGLYWPNDVDAITVRGGYVTTSATWHNLDVPFTFDGDVTIEATTGNALVDVDAGTVIFLAPGFGIDVSNNGGLALNGTSGEHVTITSEKAIPAAGDWEEIDVYAGSVDAQNVFTYADIAYGGSAGYGQVWLEDGAGLTLDNVTFMESGSGCDMYFDLTNVEPAGFVTLGTNTYDVCIH